MPCRLTDVGIGGGTPPASARVVQIRSQRAVGEVLLPQSRSELRYPTRRVCPHTLQDIDQVVVGVHVVEPACGDQALDDADVLGTEFGPAKKPRLSAHRDSAQTPLEMVGIERHVRLGKKHAQGMLSRAEVVQCQRERVAR